MAPTDSNEAGKPKKSLDRLRELHAVIRGVLAQFDTIRSVQVGRAFHCMRYSFLQLGPTLIQSLLSSSGLLEKQSTVA